MSRIHQKSESHPPPGLTNNCDVQGCNKVFASVKTLQKHKIVCKLSSESKMNTQTPTVLPASPAPIAKKKTVVAFECDHCNKLFRSKELLLIHMKEHREEEESEEESSEDEVEGVVEDHETESQTKNSDDEVRESTLLKVSLKKLESLKRKRSSLSEIISTENQLVVKMNILKRVLSQRNQLSATPPPSMKYEESSSKESDERKVKISSNKLVITRNKSKSLKKVEERFTDLLRKKKQLLRIMSMKNEESHVPDVNPKQNQVKDENKIVIPAYKYHQLKSKARDLVKIRERHGDLINFVTKIKKASEKKCTDVDENNEEVFTEQNVRPEERFQVLKNKLEGNLTKRAKLNSKIEEIMKRKFSLDDEEMLERRMKARLQREETVREVQRRIDEKKEAEREKELSLREKELRQTIESLKTEVKDVSESLSPSESVSKKKSRREMRKHLQDNFGQKLELAMSAESRLKIIREMEQEKVDLERKLETLKSSTCSESSVLVKNEETSFTNNDKDEVFENQTEEECLKIEEVEAEEVEENRCQELTDNVDSAHEMLLETSTEQDDDSAAENHAIKNECIPTLEETLILDITLSDEESDDEDDDDMVQHFITKKVPVIDQVYHDEFVSLEETADHNYDTEDHESDTESINDAEEITCDDDFDEVDDSTEYVEVQVLFEDELEVRETLDSVIDHVIQMKITEENTSMVNSLIDDILEETVIKDDIIEPWDLDILDSNWSQAEAFKKVFDSDEDSRDILAIFNSGSLTRQLLRDSLTHLGWLSHHHAQYLPPGWFIKRIDDQTCVNFAFITNNLNICESVVQANSFMRHHGFSDDRIEDFMRYFIETDCDANI